MDLIWCENYSNIFLPPSKSSESRILQCSSFFQFFVGKFYFRYRSTLDAILRINWYFNRIQVNLTSNLCRIFRLRGVHEMFGGSDFSRVERNFTIGQSPKIWGNFSKICIKINKKLKNIEKIREKMQIFQKNFLIFGRAINF